MPATKSSRTNLLTMSYDVVACYVQWFMGQHLGSTEVMPLGEICQLCKRHRPRYRRQCVRCNKLVGPGCDPEQCLYADYGNATGICRDCHRIAQDYNVWADCRKCGGAWMAFSTLDNMMTSVNSVMISRPLQKFGSLV